VFNEPRLFLSGTSLPVDHPLVHLSLIDEATLDFLLVMEDVTARGGDPRDATRPLAVEQAANGVRALARLHSAFWSDRLDAQPALAWVEPLNAWRGMGRGIDIGMERAGNSIRSTVQAMTGDEIEDHWVRFVDVVGDGPATLLHGDAHIGNTYVLPDDEVGFLDWQVVRRGNYSLDLGYFLQGAVTIEDRRACEADLVHEYVEALELDDADRPSHPDAWLRYRASAAHGLARWLATAASRWQRQEVSLTLAERYAAAFVELDSLSALEALGV
jgi:aminoglycoside phosphotransferase (APT) family kinase protein